MWRTIAEFLALRRNTSLLLVALVLAAQAKGFGLVFAPNISNTWRGRVHHGLFDALQTLAGTNLRVSGRWLTDHWDNGGRCFCSNAISLAGYFIVLPGNLDCGAARLIPVSPWKRAIVTTTFAVVATRWSVTNTRWHRRAIMVRAGADDAWTAHRRAGWSQSSAGGRREARAGALHALSL